VRGEGMVGCYIQYSYRVLKSTIIESWYRLALNPPKKLNSSLSEVDIGQGCPIGHPKLSPLFIGKIGMVRISDKYESI